MTILRLYIRDKNVRIRNFSQRNVLTFHLPDLSTEKGNFYRQPLFLS
jgi:hypothetical protein